MHVESPCTILQANKNKHSLGNTVLKKQKQQQKLPKT